MAIVVRIAYWCIITFFKIYAKIACWAIGILEYISVPLIDSPPLPPVALRYRVHCSPSRKAFLTVGEITAHTIRQTLQKNNIALDSCKRILDFGCGCGRTLRHFSFPAGTSGLYGTDVDAQAIQWCRHNLPYSQFSLNNPLPPLPYDVESFDFIYAISVFTHLNEEYQYRWLEELRRVLISRGVLLMTINGSYYQGSLIHRYIADTKKEGFVFLTSSLWKGIFPDWYQSSYHSREYIFEHYPRFFSIVDYIPRGLNDHQDVVVLQKP